MPIIRNIKVKTKSRYSFEDRGTYEIDFGMYSQKPFK